MQLNVEEKSSVKKVLHIEIPKEDVAKELDAAYNELKKTATVKGSERVRFPGKYWRPVFQRMCMLTLCPI